MKQIKDIERYIIDRNKFKKSFLTTDLSELYTYLIYDVASFWGHDETGESRENAAGTAWTQINNCLDNLDNKRIEWMEN